VAYDELVGINVEKTAEKINIRGTLRLREPMSEHTSFGIGGPADLYAVPQDVAELLALLRFAEAEGLPHFILGGGANILVADAGIRGMVIDMRAFAEIEREGTSLSVGAGTAISAAAEAAAAEGLSGLEFIYRMPGSTGGALWMNARCYGSSIVDVTERVDYLDRSYRHLSLDPSAGEVGFSYKFSPFQHNGGIILRARFRLQVGEAEAIRRRMEEVAADRYRKGHFSYPSAGSVFKNNRAFGSPTGKILDQLGLRGLRHGGAQIAPFHGNIIINLGNATAEDVRALVERARSEAYEQRGLILEPEIRFIGEWREE
jgi:UDP-N-acetylmuramate dehydrogenase